MYLGIVLFLETEKDYRYCGNGSQNDFLYLHEILFYSL